MPQDGDFNRIGDAFETDVYGSSKGLVRLNVLWEDLLDTIPRVKSGGLRILDAGGGAGHLAIRLAQAGHTVVLAEPARAMRERAEAAIRAAGLVDNISLVPATLEELTTLLHETFDVVVCHAVLEWLAEPQQGLASLVPLLADDGQLSLLYYNRNAAFFKRVLRGEFELALRELEGDWQPRGWGEGCMPLAEADVRSWLTDLGLVVQSKAGIRIFHDHVSAEARNRDGIDALVRLERACSRQEPFASLAQHIHLVCGRTT